LQWLPQEGSCLHLLPRQHHSPHRWYLMSSFDALRQRVCPNWTI